MTTPSKRALVRALFERHGQTFAEELNIPIQKNTPSVLFQLLVASLLYGARISARNATSAIRALFDARLTTPQKMAAATWQQRVDIITWHGYKRYDERTSRMLGELAQELLERYHGDLRNLREEAGREVEKERELLVQFKGIGPVGANIFLREVQLAWDEVYPFADDRVLRAARQLGLGADIHSLAKLVSRRDFARLAAALIRTELGHDYDEITELAA